MKPPEGMSRGVWGQHEVEPRHAVRPKRMVLSTEWARWPWQTCRAVTYDEYGTCRCDLRKRHGGHHRAERGMYDVVWSSVPRKVERAHG